ncbi:hypothetical protein DY000_02020840 [Brassica cretica]|uniref:Serine-threonine/tyrosine-protein kinase catalytic domain-containing protein n=1 Tax=Brassica cretica TaxID=69181 RepID=A0ABQ7E434_BRACR|nr:hypothetical protein DY000_02020840 [Brassica cretica]
MVATLVLIRDENGDMHDQDGQRLDDDQRDVIHDPEAANPQAANAENDAANAQAVAEENVQTARPRTLVATCPPNTLEGKFSMKLDVYSFGVLLLEIISSKRNKGFYNSDHEFNLL